MVGINMEDVIGVLQTCKWYLVTLGVLLAVGLVVVISCHWIAKPTRQLVRSSTFVGMVASIVAVASLICLGPMSTLIGLTMGSIEHGERSHYRGCEASGGTDCRRRFCSVEE